MSKTDAILFITLGVIFVLWSGAWFRDRAKNSAPRLYLSMLASVLTLFIVIFFTLHYVLHIA